MLSRKLRDRGPEISGNAQRPSELALGLDVNVNAVGSTDEQVIDMLADLVTDLGSTQFVKRRHVNPDEGIRDDLSSDTRLIVGAGRYRCASS